MRHLRTLLLACVAVTSPGLAGAADMPWSHGPAVISDRPPQEEEIGTGWYLRGDIGWAKATAPSFDMGANRFSSVGRDGSFIYGGGFGYKFNEWLRADLTVDQIASYGMKRGIGSVGCFGIDTCSVGRGFDGSVIPILANAYLDLGNWGGFTPYVGGGIGAARMRASGTFTYTDPTLATTVTTMADSGVKWSPAFAAMAGLAVDLGSGIQLDAGYRYLWLSNGSTGVLTQGNALGVVPGTVEFKNSGFHQARVGLRYFVN
jgi:opacity protein-like surface antigen